MTRKKYILQIENPCGEKWSEMTQNETGRFCAHCSKTVVDFTKMNDRQIVRVIENSSEKICGRLLNSQMNRIIADDSTENSFYKFPCLVAGLLLAGTATNTIAQSNEVQTEMVSNRDSVTEFTMGKPLLSQTDSAKNVIQGKVLDENKESMINAVVVVIDDKGKHTTTGTVTDFDGNFKLYIPDELFNNDSNQVTIRISYVGHKAFFVTFRKSEFPINNKVFELSSVGEIVTTGVIISYPYLKPQIRKKKHK